MYLLSMMNAFSCLLAPFIGVASAVFPNWFSDLDSCEVVFPAGLTPIYDKPRSGGLPVSYCEPSDTCRIDSSAVDSSGAEWLLINYSSKSGWVRKASVASPGAAGEERPAIASPAGRFDPDSKRRRRILEKHPEWPRRILKVVREGNICLDMNVEQLEAAWGTPSQKKRAFILGAGAQDLWLYKGGDGSTLVVFLVKGRVVGWSE